MNTIPARRPRARPEDRVLRYIDFVLIPVFAASVVARGDYGTRFWIGMAVGAFGIALWVLARLNLGSSFAVRPEAKKLVTTGLYSRIRNPVYVFGGIGYLGLFMALGNWPAVGVFVVIFVFYQSARIRKEERVLEDAFGEEYRRYKARTWF